MTELVKEWYALQRGARRFTTVVNGWDGAVVWPPEDVMRADIARAKVQRMERDFDGWIVCADGRTLMEYQGVA